MYREEWDTGSSEAASVTARGNDHIGSAEPSSSGASRGAFLSLFSDVWVIGKRWLQPADQRDQIVSSCRYTYV